ncbi:hypothetical protein Nepgr_023152 [Nepenthes gracilis]|uniref:Uncharacterized protein n=1 Tax=Nepenthes gracilis TaxID=150966 RepID=A0AAD3T1Y2_NEPGR|nr:hypothetical protein Nepgr_023152 [Nepenthes gracilis]
MMHGPLGILKSDAAAQTVFHGLCCFLDDESQDVLVFCEGMLCCSTFVCMIDDVVVPHVAGRVVLQQNFAECYAHGPAWRWGLLRSCYGPAGRGGTVEVNEMLPKLVHSAAVSVASDAWNAGSHDSVMLLVANVMELLIVHVSAVTWVIWNLDRFWFCLRPSCGWDLLVLHAAAALFEPIFRFVDDEAFLIPYLIPLVWRGFPLFYHDCFMSAGRTMMHHCQCTMPGLARDATEGASSSSMVGFPAGRVFGVRNVFEESHVMLI